jgi:hypothetical protein
MLFLLLKLDLGRREAPQPVFYPLKALKGAIFFQKQPL